MNASPAAPLPSSARPLAPVAPAGSFVGIYGWGLGLAALLMGLLVWDNRQYLFHASLYERSDWAADSLFVQDAKHGAVLHGHYSRWHFYHPGPVLFYVYAFGEGVFYDWLHIVPTPYNGQLLALCAAMTIFLGLALAIFAQRLEHERGGGGFFLGLALLFGVWHYGAAAATAPVFLETWPACPLVLTFLCFLVASASAASGGGRELPLVALTGGWLVHNYVAEPLFVVPMTLLAYGGLLAWCRRNTPAGASLGWRAGLTAGWRIFPRAHLVAGGILLLFIAPVAADMLRGRESNFHDILVHLRRPHEPMHKFPRALCYFLTFGSYSAYDPAESFFGRYSARGLLAFAALHWRPYLCWVVALGLTPVLFVAARHVERSAAAAGTATLPRRSRFLAWFGAMSLLACALTLFWGMKQDGDMLYFNAYFSYSIYYCAALGLAAALAVFLQAVTAPGHRRRVRVGLGVLLACGVVAAAYADAGRFQVHTLDTPADRAAAQTVTEAAAATLPAGGVCNLDCARQELWPTMVAVALQLERLGYQVRVGDRWGVMYGRQRTLARHPVDFSRPLARWTVVSDRPDPSRPGPEPRRLVLQNSALAVMDLADLDPAGGRIRFSVDGNADAYVCYGWTPADGEWTWSDQREALLQFRPLPLPPACAGGVDMIVEAWSFNMPDYPVSQRLETVFDGATLPTVYLPATAGTGATVTLHIAAEQWRDAVARGFAKLLCRFPDARSPAELGANTDSRLLGGGFRQIEFRPVP